MMTLTRVSTPALVAAAALAVADEPVVDTAAPSLEGVCLYDSAIYSEGAQAVLNGVSMVCVRDGQRLVWQRPVPGSGFCGTRTIRRYRV